MYTKGSNNLKNENIVIRKKIKKWNLNSDCYKNVMNIRYLLWKMYWIQYIWRQRYVVFILYELISNIGYQYAV